MPRKGIYRTRTVTGYFQAAPFDWANEKRLQQDPHLRGVVYTFIVLDCGHIKRDPWEVYQNETAVRMAAILHHTMTPGAVRKVRCHQCVSGREQGGVPKVRPEVIPPLLFSALVNKSVTQV